MAILGGSPLGLIGVLSTPTRDGMSTFNAGKSRNINVINYNSGKGKDSIFTGRTKYNPWPNISIIGSDRDGSGTSNAYKGINRNSLHNNDVYDTSLLNIIEKLSLTKGAQLRPADFAYLKDLGVYPNNRLMIARKFTVPIPDDILRVKRPARSVLISWVPQGDEDFLSFTFGEEWEDANADFTEVLNKLGEDFMGKKLGTKIAGAAGLIPLPGFTEILQRKVLSELGIIDPGSNGDLPSGNPNLIKEAKKRKTVGYGTADSGLKCTINIKMSCEYEQKFISGIDPTVAWMDIVQNILSFGTQDSNFYGLSTNAAKKIVEFTEQPHTLIESIVSGLKKAFNELKDEVAEQYQKVKENITNPPKKSDTPEEKLNSVKKSLDAEFDKIINASKEVLGKTVRKYLEEIKGITKALSGLPSTPWHITIGNPLRPVFCSGDMLTQEVTLKLGPVLAFNDLPSSIKAEFTLTNARPLGLQEIMAKFNTGNIRVVNVARDSTQFGKVNPADASKIQYMYNFDSNGDWKGLDSATSSSIGGDSSNPKNTPATPTQPETKENAKSDNVINSDANSNKSII